MDDKLPATPKKRYSCISEYATPKESDDSIDDLYFSFILSEDDDILNKENSINNGQWTITDNSKSPVVSRLSKATTPLLRKVLQTNHTPRNKNNKRVSFSHLSKPSPSAIAAPKFAKIKENLVHSVDLDRNFDLKRIEESLPIISAGKLIDQKNEEKSENVADFNTSTDITDGMENELHNTIIENPSSSWSSTLCTEESIKDSKVTSIQYVKMCAPSEILKSPKLDNLANYSKLQNVTPHTMQNTKTIEEVLHETHKDGPATRNMVKINRKRVVNDSRKSILPIPKKPTRATTYKRRSSTYELRKVDPRKSLGVLKQVASKVTKTIGG